ncbi:MAG: TonB-dependent receptor [Saprospiraceae bacterium]|nr:TonB-dependent receptor [Saprospiraceae bacterium]
MKQLFFLLFTLYLSNAFSQVQTISIKLTEPNGAPIVGSAVVLTERNDTLRKQYAITDTAGLASFNIGKERQFVVLATFIGLKPLQRGVTVTDKQAQFTFVMETLSAELKGVEIVAKKPLMTQEDDKTVVDAEQLALTSTNALEVMEKTPGLFIDQDGNIYITSGTPAAVYINGREQRMSNADIAALLRILPPNSIEKIEILRTPSAKYDASSSGGLVNVVLKKGVKIGLTGNVNAGVNQGVYGNRFVGLNLNNNEGERTSFFNVNAVQANGFNKVTSDRILTDNTLHQYSYTKTPSDALSMGFGLGRELKKKWTLNYDARGNYSNNRSDANTESVIKSRPSESLLSDNDNQLKNNNKNINVSQGFSAKLKMDTLGSEWTTDVNYNFSNNQGEQDYTTTFTLPIVNPINGNGDWDNKRHFFSMQTDVKYKLPHQVTLETGAKTTFQRFDSETAYFINAKKDDFRTNTYRFKENINAAYLQGSKKMGDYLLKVGVRLENTNMSGNQTIPKDTSFGVHRTDLFPYLYFSRKVAKIAGYELRGYLVARRTITRPTYEMLNPFPRFLDQFLYEAGNPSLKPQFTQNYEFNISVNEMPIMAFGRNYTQDIFTNVIYPDPQTPIISYRTYDNLGKNVETYGRLTGAIPPGKKYFFVVGIQYNHNNYNGVYADSALSFQRGSWSFFTYHSLKIGKLTNISMNGFLRLKGQLQFYELDNFGALNFYVNRQFLDRKLIVSLNFSDVFLTNRYSFTLNQGAIQALGTRANDTRRIGLNIRYIFGLRKKEKRENMFDIPEGGS